MADCAGSGDVYGPPVMPIETPCQNICVLHVKSGLCRGCGRSLAEIEHWMRYEPRERRRIMAELPDRLAALKLPRAPVTAGKV